MLQSVRSQRVGHKLATEQQYVYYIFIHSSVDGNFSYFHVLTIVNSVSVNIGVHVRFRFEASFIPNSLYHLISQQ